MDQLLSPVLDAWRDLVGFGAEQLKMAIATVVTLALGFAVTELKRRWSSAAIEEPLLHAALDVEERGRAHEVNHGSKLPSATKRRMALSQALPEVHPIHRFLNGADRLLVKHVLPEVRRLSSVPPAPEPTPTKKVPMPIRRKRGPS